MAYSFDLSVGWSVTLVAFAIMIIGGPGSVMGAVVIGMAFGFTQAAVGAFFGPIVATFSYLVMMLLVLLFRPAGLFVR
jgi:branched-chain amino acid transport system permease protein